MAEIQAVREFTELTDELGFPVPHANLDSQNWDAAFAICDRPRINSSSPAVFALAQHHGVPTRLLDFTRRSTVAAFFATNHLAIGNKCDNARELAVWAVNTEALKQQKCRIAIETCPRHQMGFLHAQDAVFAFDAEAPSDYMNGGVWPAIDAALVHYANELSSRQVVLRKLTLPVEESQTLMQLLWKERVSLAHLMPILDNVTKSLLSRWDWSEHPIESVPGTVRRS